MKILVFQHGDFGEAWRRLQSGEPESYRDQKKSVEFVASFREEHRVLTLAVCGREHHEDLAENLTSVGIVQATSASADAMADLLDGLAPNIIICRSPNLHLLRWARRNRVPTLPIFADIFSNGGLRKLRRNLLLRATLLDPVFPCVANHSLNASLSVHRALFFPQDRIVPWDRAALTVEPQAKAGPGDLRTPSLFFAGMLTEAKGVGDCLQAVRLLHDRGLRVIFRFAGPGDADPWVRKAQTLGIANQVQFLGQIANTEVRQGMRDSDIVVVASRHDYPEGLPNTICEGLASRTPLVISDHPAFASRLQQGRDCLIFAAGAATSLADQVLRLMADPFLYAALSQQSPAAYASLYFGIEWTKLVSTFIADPENHTGWVAAHSLRRLLQTDLQTGASWKPTS